MATRNTSRRGFIRQLGYAACALPGLSGLAFASDAGYSPAAAGQRVQQNKKVLGVALVGLGKYSEGQLAPALQETKHCRLEGIVTGTPAKAEKWKKKYSIPDKNIYSYSNFDNIKNNPEIDIVYVVLPNALHSEYVIRAAQAGKHVICEKPMATTVQECEAMIEACEKANRMLSIGYRLYFEPHNLTIIDMAQKKTYGAVREIKAQHGMDIEPNVWRLDKTMAGGGPLVDVGIYCIQAAIYTLGQLPVAVTAHEGEKTDLSRFRDVEQSLYWQMEFPGGIKANCATSYAQELNQLRVEAEKGWFELQPAYAYKGIEGKTSLGKLRLSHVNQQALQMDDFAQCILTGKKTRVPGEMGLRDVKIIQAIYDAARTGKRIELDDLAVLAEKTR